MLALLFAGSLVVMPPAELADRATRAAGLFFTGTYVTLALLRNRSLFTRCVVATATAAAFTAGWFLALRLRFAALRESLSLQAWTIYRAVISGLPETPPPTSDPLVGGTSTDLLGWEVARTAEQWSEVFPAVTAVMALAGGWLAWSWYHRLASTPIGSPPRRFRHFRFSDHLVWWLVLSLGATLVTLPAGAHLTAKNLLVVILALYAARGLAVLRTMLLQSPPLMTALLCLIALPLLPLAFAGCVAFGVADTWLDLRRRVPPPEGVSP